MKIQTEKNPSIEKLDKALGTIYLCDNKQKKYLNEYLFYKLNSKKTKKIPKKLPGSIWAVTTFFNPGKYKNKYENYSIFREKSKKQGLKLLTVELVFDNNKFEIQEEDADMLIQIRGNEKNIMWQKESMLNIGIKKLPVECDKIIWTDCDIFFRNNNWVTETAKLLEEYVIVQPFSSVIRLPKDFKRTDGIENISYGSGNNKISHSFARGLHETGVPAKKMKNYMMQGEFGFVWAARREIFEDIGLLDDVIVGTNDAIMGLHFYGRTFNVKLSNELHKACNKWGNVIYKRVRGSVFYTKGVIEHLWHGKLENRMYKERNLILKKYNFDPKKDIRKNKDGIFEWCSDKKILHKKIKSFMKDRKEEGEKI